MSYPRRADGRASLLAIVCIVALPVVAQSQTAPNDLPANAWKLIDQEDASGGKRFARAVYAPNVGRLLLWGTGGAKPARNVYKRFELESFDPAKPGWHPAFPHARRGKWSANDYPPFRIWGQSGPDGLKWDEGPRLQVVSGYHSTNRIRWWDFDGVLRPSPIHTFNMAAWDSKRNRVIYYSDGVTFALDPSTNSWTDLKASNHPTTCKSVAWASMCYDPGNDRVLLFGGGLATNPTGGAPTWLYDCKTNQWSRPTDSNDPPLRCNAPIVYDPTTRQMVMFGGYNQAAALNDTWVFDCKAKRWSKRLPKVAPPPMYTPAAALLPGGGKVLVCGADARKLRMHHKATSSANKQTWVYDVAADTWTPINNGLNLPGYDWLTADTDTQRGVVLLVAFGRERRTYALRYDPNAAPVELDGAAAGTVVWKYPEQALTLEQAPPDDAKQHARTLASLPTNRFVNADPPGMLISKTWSTAVMDTDRSRVLYTGGGHSGYSGNDIAQYDVATNRWQLDAPPRFPPFLEGTNAGLFGWSYGMVPFSQHTYLWYAYDPASKTMLYLARPSIPDGTEVQLTRDGDVFTYDSKKHGYASWVYDPVARKMHPPSFGRTFRNDWHLSLVGTPRGVYAMSRNVLYHAKVDRDTGRVDWRTVDKQFPRPPDKIKYHYEYQPVVHDTKRGRLIQLKGDKQRVDVYVRGLNDGDTWRLLNTTGQAAIGREAVYVPKHDTVLWLGDRLYALDCATNEVREIKVDLPKGLYGHECALVYAPKPDVCVALIPKSFTGPMQTFLLRFKP